VNSKEQLFIYGRKEIAVLVFLGVLVTVFAFTLGVHLGKKIAPATVVHSGDTRAIVTEADQIPDRVELTEQSKGAPKAADEALDQAAHEEVARTGIKIDKYRQIELPDKAKSKNEGATTLSDQDRKKARIDIKMIPAAIRPTPEGKFTLQIGSYPELNEAKDLVDALEALGLRPYLRVADIKNKGKWFRVYMGGFASKDAANQAGEGYKSKHVINSYIIAKMAD
jgi:cell division septation protein DedD